MSKYLRNPIIAITVAAKGKLDTCAIFILIVWCMVNVIFAVVETLVWGDTFIHWLDVFIALLAITACWKCVACCIVYNQTEGAK